MDKSSSRSNTLKKFGFGRKTSSSASSSPERKPQTSKTERLRELTEKLKGHKVGSFKINSSRSVSPSIPIPPPLPAPVPPPRKFKRGSNNDISAASSLDDLDAPSSNSSLRYIGKSKSVEPSTTSTSIFARQIKNIQERFLRPNISASNLDSMNKEASPERRKTSSLNDQDIFTKLTRPESRSIVGSYTQKTIPFRSASFSQADVTSGKYVKSDINSLRASLGSKRSMTIDRSPSPSPNLRDSGRTMNESSEIVVENISNESSAKRNSEIDTICEESMTFDDRHSSLNVVQANEVTLETLIEEDPVLSVSPKLTRELQQATTCIIPIPVFECVEKEWSPLPEIHGSEGFHPISHQVTPDVPCVTESFIEVLQDPILDELPKSSSVDQLEIDPFCFPSPKSEQFRLVPQFSASSYSEDESQKRISLIPESTSLSNESHDLKSDSLDIDGSEEITTETPKIDVNENVIGERISLSIPEVELNNVTLQLDEITEKLKETISPQNEICNVVKTQIPQSKEELLHQKSVDSLDEIRISPEIQEVLETVAETLNEEHKFLTNAVGNANINIVSLICPDHDFNNEKTTSNGSKFELLKAAVDSSPEPGSFDKSDIEFPEVRKRHSNENSGSEKSSPNASPNTSIDDKRKLDKSRRRKGIYIQWPAIEKSNDVESFDSSVNEDNNTLSHINTDEKIRRQNYAESKSSRQSESMGSFEPCTPDSDIGNRPPIWPKGPTRRQSLTYQSSDERDDFTSANSPPIRPFRSIFLRSDSVSDNELSDRASSRDRSLPFNEQDLRRYSKRPLRGPYGQMLEAEMKKPNKVCYDGILEELQRSDR
jgi:hypothetical protein